MKGQSSQSGVDTRAPITMWELLVWAYKRQMVHYEIDRHEPEWRTDFLATSSTWRVGSALSHGGYARGAINGAGSTAHPDAHIVHAHVMALEAADRDLIIRTAERGTPPDPNPVLPPCRIVPARKGGTGAIRMLYGRSGRPIACLLEYEGIPEREALSIRDAARKTYSQWSRVNHSLYSLMLIEHDLTRWRVTAAGAPPMGQNDQVET